MENYCVVCGTIIPEGRMVCPICEEKVIRQSKHQNDRDSDKKHTDKPIRNLLKKRSHS